MTATPLGRAAARRGRAWLGKTHEASALVDMTGEWTGGTTSEQVRAATITALRQHLGDHYTRRPGIAALCKAVAGHLASQGVNVDPNNGVVITGGQQEARFVAIRALAAGKRVWLPQLAPLGVYADAARFADAPIERFDPEGTLPTTTRDLLVLPNPNPATGQLYEASTLQHLARWAGAHAMTVIADETAAPLVRPGLRFIPFAAQAEVAEQTLTLGSFAAAPGMAAWQVAWFAGPLALAPRVRDLKQSMTICSPALSQYAALAGDAAPAGAVGEQQAAQLDSITSLLQRLGIPFREPHTVAYVVADVESMGGGDVVAATCAAHGIAVLSGSALGHPGSVRIGVPPDHFEAALEKLATALTTLRSKPGEVTA